MYLQGPSGDSGADGRSGLKGPRGYQGSIGPTGHRGEEGETVSNDTCGYTLTPATFTNMLKIRKEQNFELRRQRFGIDSLQIIYSSGCQML